jgi:hypothetical protein
MDAAAAFASPHLVDLVLALMALETLALLYFHRRTGRGIAPRDLLPNVLAGAFLLLALRAALADAAIGWLMAALLLALAAHLADLARRWSPHGR